MDAFYEMMKPENAPYGMTSPNGKFSLPLSLFPSLSLSLSWQRTDLSLLSLSLDQVSRAG